jgi:phosphoinositide-3-kinase regulatory subunit 4
MPAVYILHDYLLNPAQPDSPYKHALLFTGGDDRDLRYWDIQRPENSFIISGPELHNEDAMALKTKYELTYPLALSAGAQIALIQEKISDEASSGGASSSRGTPKKSSRSIRDQAGNVRTSSPASTSATSPSKTSSSSSSSSKPPRSTVISGAQQQILRTHMEGITDVVVLRKPYGCVVSVDRAGTIFIFH